MDNVPPCPAETTWEDPEAVVIFGGAEPGPPDPDALNAVWWPGFGCIAYYATEEEADGALLSLQTAHFDQSSPPED